MDAAAITQEILQLRQDLDDCRLDQQNLVPNANRVPEIGNAVGRLQRHVSNLQDSGIARSSQTIPIFSGTYGESFTDWCEMFILIADGQQWDAARRCIKLPTFLRGAALEVYKDQPNATKQNLDLLCEALRERLEPVENRRFLSAELHGRRQSIGESVNEFAQVIKKLVRTSYRHMGDDDRAMLFHEFFRNGHQKSVRSLLELRRPATFDEAITEAQIIEMNQRLNSQNRAVLSLIEDEVPSHNMAHQLSSIEKGLKDLSAQVSPPKVVAAVHSTSSPDDNRLSRLENRLDSLLAFRPVDNRRQSSAPPRFGTNGRSFVNYPVNGRNYGNSTNYTPPANRNGAPASGSTGECFHCGQYGHFRASCPHRPGARPFRQFNQNFSRQQEYGWTGKNNQRRGVNAITTAPDMNFSDYATPSDEFQQLQRQNERLTAQLYPNFVGAITINSSSKPMEFVPHAQFDHTIQYYLAKWVSLFILALLNGSRLLKTEILLLVVYYAFIIGPAVASNPTLGATTSTPEQMLWGFPSQQLQSSSLDLTSTLARFQTLVYKDLGLIINPAGMVITASRTVFLPVIIHANHGVLNATSGNSKSTRTNHRPIRQQVEKVIRRKELEYKGYFDNNIYAQLLEGICDKATNFCSPDDHRDKRFLGILGGILGLAGSAFGVGNSIRISRLTSKVEALTSAYSDLHQHMNYSNAEIKKLAIAQENSYLFAHKAMDEVHAVLEKIKCEGYKWYVEHQQWVYASRVGDFIDQMMDAALFGTVKPSLMDLKTVRDLIASDESLRSSIYSNSPDLFYQLVRAYPIYINFRSVKAAFILELPIPSRMDVLPLLEINNVGWNVPKQGLSKMVQLPRFATTNLAQYSRSYFEIESSNCVKRNALWYCPLQALVSSSGQCLSHLINDGNYNESCTVITRKMRNDTTVIDEEWSSISYL